MEMITEIERVENPPGQKRQKKTGDRHGPTKNKGTLPGDEGESSKSAKEAEAAKSKFTARLKTNVLIPGPHQNCPKQKRRQIR
jgi:hypothetical protein